MASFFNMKGTTQNEFMIGVKGPILQRSQYTVNATSRAYLTLPDYVIASKIMLSNINMGATGEKYINAEQYTGNAATATKLSSKNIGLSIDGMVLTHKLDANSAENTGLSDGSGLIYAQIVSIDSSKLIKGNNGGMLYSVLEDLVTSGDLNPSNDIATSHIASATHIHSQYLRVGSDGLTVTTKNGETTLGDVKINNQTETATVTAGTTVADPQTIKLDLELRAGSVGETELATNAVTTNKIKTGAVTMGKIADGQIRPKHLENYTLNSADNNGDYSAKIWKVYSANHLNAGGTIAGINISDILYAETINNTSTLTSTVNSAFNAYNIYNKSDNTYKSASDVISAVNKVGNASKTKSENNLVLWSSNGINGDITGKAASATSADSATKLTTAKTLWGNSFDGSADIGTSTTAANIQYTGDITPKESNKSNLGSDNLKYKNLYIAGTAYTNDISALGTATVKKLTISTTATGSNATDDKVCIDLNSHNIANGKDITADRFLPLSTGSNKSLGADGSGFSSIWLGGTDFSAIKVRVNTTTTANLQNVLDGKADTSHSHNLSAITVDASAADIASGFFHGLALSSHTHSLDQITGLDGIYRFKGTKNEILVDQNNGNRLYFSDQTDSNTNHGDVYNVLHEFVYEGETYPAGTNVVYEKDVPVENTDPVQYTGVWKPLGGTFNVELGDYMTGVESDAEIYKSLLHGENDKFTAQALIDSFGLDIKFTGRRDKRTNEDDRKFSYWARIPRATATNFGLIKTITADMQESDQSYGSETPRRYGIKINSEGYGYVDVPWEDKDTVDKYSIITTDSTAAITGECPKAHYGRSGFENEWQDKVNASGILTGTNKGIFNDNQLKIRSVHFNGTNYTVDKSISIRGTGQAIVKYKTYDANSHRDGDLTIDVPDRAGYGIPIIKCMGTPEFVDDTPVNRGRNPGISNKFLFSAVDSDYDGNGVFSTDDNKIKDGSLVLLYLDKPHNLFKRRISNETYPGRQVGFQNGTGQIIIRVPRSSFLNSDLDANSDILSKLNKSYIDFKLLTPEREALYMYFTDLSKKFFLCQINIGHGQNTVPGDDHFNEGTCHRSTIKIVEDIGATFEKLDPPNIVFKNGEFRLCTINNTLSSLFRRYNGIGDIYIRTLHLNKKGRFTHTPELDFNLSQEVISSEYVNVNNRNFIYKGLESQNSIYSRHPRLYTKNELLNMICTNYNSSNPSFMIQFKNDCTNWHFHKAHLDENGNPKRSEYVNKKRNVGLIKKTGNVSLSELNIEREQKTYMRNYDKLKFQYVLHFNISDLYDIAGKLSPDEFTITKTYNGCGKFGFIVKNNSK